MGGERERRHSRDRASSRGAPGQSGGVSRSSGASVVPPGTEGGGGSPPPSMDLPRRGAAAVAAGGTGRVTAPAWGGPWGPLRRGRGCRADTVPGTGGLAPGDRRGMGVERPGAPIPCPGAARARGAVARWGRLVGSGSGGGGVVAVVPGALVAVALVVVMMVLRVRP